MEKETYSKGIAGAIKSWLEENGFKYRFDKKNGRFRFDTGIGSKDERLRHIIEVLDDGYEVFSLPLFGADRNNERMMREMAEFACRVNAGARYGNIELEMETGLVFFRCFVDCEGITPSAEIVRNSILGAAAKFDMYKIGMIDVIKGTCCPKEAVEKCERKTREELESD